MNDFEHELTFASAQMRRTAQRIHELSRDLRLIQKGLAPTSEELYAAPKLEEWMLTYRFEPALTGIVSGHPSLADGPVTTSGIYILDREAGFVRTLSRFYALGRSA
jgi:hypothetical protein